MVAAMSAVGNANGNTTLSRGAWHQGELAESLAHLTELSTLTTHTHTRTHTHHLSLSAGCLLCAHVALLRQHYASRCTLSRTQLLFRPGVMRFDVVHGDPLTVDLAERDSVQAESGTLVAMSGGLTVRETEM